MDSQSFDAAVTTGCGACPRVVADGREDWQIPGPKDLPPDEFQAVRDLIGRKVRELAGRL